MTTQQQLVFKTTSTALVVVLFCFTPVVYFWNFACNDARLTEQAAGEMGYCGPLDFMQLRHPVTGLASFPGSGNTMLRSMIQESTGTWTGSEYFDEELARIGFHGEGMSVHRNGSHIIIVKTHDSDSATRERYDRVLLLVRHPKEAILSEFNRASGGGHFDEASEEKFKHWPEFLQLHLAAWNSFHRHWLTFNRSMLIVFYNDLISEPAIHLRRMLRFLQVNVSETRLACAISQSQRYRRSRSGRQTNLYSREDERTLDKVYNNITQEILQRGLIDRSSY